MKLELLKQAIENEQKISELSGERDLEDSVHADKVKIIKDKYRELSRELERAEDKEIEPLDYENERKGEEYTLKINELYNAINQRDRIIQFFHIIKNNEKDDLNSPNYYEDFLVDTIVEDGCSKLVAIIREGSEKINNYSLYLCCSSIFNSRLSSWLLNNRNYKKLLRNSYSRENLIKYWNNHKNRILELIPIKEELDNLKIEYDEAVKLYNIKEWKIAFLESQKEYYEERYHRGRYLQEYKELVKELCELSDNPRYKSEFKKIILNELNGEEYE